MKKGEKKLQLHRETLRLLEDEPLGHLQGGINPIQHTVTATQTCACTFTC